MSSGIVVRPVAGRHDLRVFMNLPRRLYAGDEYWVPPLSLQEKKTLSRKRNPFYAHADAEFFLAWRGDEAVGRIAAIENRLHNRYRGDRVGFFGHYEAVDDAAVSAALVDSAARWLRERGLETMRGPVNPTMNGNVGFLVDGFDQQPSILMPYTKRYYLGHARDRGFDKAMDVIIYGWRLAIYDTATSKRLLGKAERIERFVKERCPIAVRRVDMKKIDREVAIVQEICNESLKDNWGYVPLTDAEMADMARSLRMIVDPDMFLIGEIDGKPEAVYLALPDYNRLVSRIDGKLFPFGWLTFLLNVRKIDRYNIYLYGATRKGELAGISGPIYAQFFRECFRKGISDYETGYILETNLPLRNMLEKYGGTPRRRYRIFEKRI